MSHLSQNFFYVYKKSMDTYYMELILIGGGIVLLSHISGLSLVYIF